MAVHTDKSVVRKWGFRIVYDDNISIFVSLSDVHGKPLKFCLCRSNYNISGFCQNQLTCRPNKSNDIVISDEMERHHQEKEINTKTTMIL